MSIPLSRAGGLAWLLVATSASRVWTQAKTKDLAALPLSTWHASDSATRSCQTPGRNRIIANCPLPATTFSATKLKEGVRLVMKLENACQWQYRGEYRVNRDTLQVWMWPVDYRADVGCPGTWYDAWETTVPYISDSVHRAALRVRPPSQHGAPDVTVEIARLPPEQ